VPGPFAAAVLDVLGLLAVVLSCLAGVMEAPIGAGGASGVSPAASVAAGPLGAAPDPLGVLDRVVRRFSGSSAGLMTRAYVSVILFLAQRRLDSRRNTNVPCYLPDQLRARRSGNLSRPDNAAWDVLLRVACSHRGRPRIRASPHTAQAHSWQSPSGTSGQLAGSAWNCSKSRSSLHPVQYLLRYVIVATSSLRCIKGLTVWLTEGWNGPNSDVGTPSRRCVGSQTACLLAATVR
jgi:hypothetical protein